MLPALSDTSRRRSLLGAPWAVAAVASATVVLATACNETGAPPSDARTVKVGQSGESTYVSISEPSNVKKNAVCVEYCDRLAECWYAVSTGAQALTRDEVRDRCRAEQDDCRVKTKASHCCGRLTDCLEFAECHAKSGEEPAECRVEGSSEGQRRK